MEFLMRKYLTSMVMWGVIGCTYAGVVLEPQGLNHALYAPDGLAAPDDGVALLESVAWVCCREGEMVGAVLPYVRIVGASGSADTTRFIAEIDSEICRNYSESRRSKFGRWYGFVNAKVWVVGGSLRGGADHKADKCVQMKPMRCEHMVSSSPRETPEGVQSAPPYVKRVMAELERLGDRSVVIRSGTKKLARAKETADQGTVFYEGFSDDRERHILEYSVLGSDCQNDAEMACCWQLRKGDGTLLKSGVWKSGEVGAESEMISVCRNEQGNSTLVFRFGDFGAEVCHMEWCK